MNHFIALSSDRFFLWNYDEEPRAIKAGWSCGYKVLITPRKTVSVACPMLAMYHSILAVEAGGKRVSRTRYAVT